MLSMMCYAHLGVEWQQVQREPRSRSCVSHGTGRLFNVSESSPHLPVRDSANKVNTVPQAATQAFSLTRQRNLGAPAVPHPEMFFRKRNTPWCLEEPQAKPKPYLASKRTVMPWHGDVSSAQVSNKEQRPGCVCVTLITVPYRDYTGVKRIRVRASFPFQA